MFGRKKNDCGSDIKVKNPIGTKSYEPNKCDTV